MVLKYSGVLPPCYTEARQLESDGQATFVLPMHDAPLMCWAFTCDGVSTGSFVTSADLEAGKWKEGVALGKGLSLKLTVREGAPPDQRKGSGSP